MILLSHYDFRSRIFSNLLHVTAMCYWSPSRFPLALIQPQIRPFVLYAAALFQVQTLNTFSVNP